MILLLKGNYSTNAELQISFAQNLQVMLDVSRSDERHRADGEPIVTSDPCS
jgi:hypothetical protein